MCTWYNYTWEKNLVGSGLAACKESISQVLSKCHLKKRDYWIRN